MKDLKTEEYFSSGFQLGKSNYWTIFFNVLLYGVIYVVFIITILGILLLPALGVGFYKFLLRAARGENVDVGDSLSEGFKNGMWWKSLAFFVLYVLLARHSSPPLTLLASPGVASKCHCAW